MTVSEVSAVLVVNDSRVRQLARAGSLKGERRGRDWFFLRADVEEYELSLIHISEPTRPY